MNLFEWLFHKLRELIKQWNKPNKPDENKKPEPVKPTPEPQPEPEPLPEPKFYEGLKEINEIRAKHGLYPLEPDDSLYKASEKHAAWMNERKNMSHRGESGSTPSQRAIDAGFPSQWIRENVAWNARNIDDVMNMWYNSSGHKANMLNKDCNKYGYAVNGAYYCQMFGKR